MYNSRLNYKYQADIKKSYKPLTWDEEKALVILAKNKDAKALQTLLNAQLNQIIKQARSFVTEDSTLADLIGEGTLGFYKGVEEFDETRGFRLITFTMHWIKAYVSKAAHENSTIRHPNNIHDIHTKTERARNKIIQGMEVDKDAIEMVEEADRRLSIKYNVRSFDEPVGDEKQETTLGDKLGQDDSDIAAVQNMIGVVKVLDLLNDTEKEIFELYFGLNGKDRHTVDEISDILGPRARSGTMTKQNVSLIKNKAIKRMHQHFKVKAKDLVEVD